MDELLTTTEIKNEDLERIDDVGIPSDLKIKTIEVVYQKVMKIQKELENRKIEFGKKNTSLDNEIKKISEEKSEYESKKIDLDESIKKYDEELQEINKLRVGNFANIIDKKVIDKYSEGLDEQKNLLLSEIENLKIVQTKYLDLIVSKEREIFESKEDLTAKKLELGKEFQTKFEVKEIELENLQKY